MTTSVIGTVVLLTLMAVIAIIDARTRRIPEVLCVSGMGIALALALLAPNTRLEDWPGFVLQVAAPSIPSAMSESLWALFVTIGTMAFVIFFVQPGMLVDGRHGTRGAVTHFFVSIARRGVLWIAVPLTALASLIIISAWFIGGQTWHAVLACVFGSLCGIVILGVPYLVGRTALRTHALGSGDVLLMAMVGAFTGWQPLVPIFGLTLLGIAAVSALARFSNRYVFPCGPIIAVATTVTVLAWPWLWRFLAASRVPAWGIAMIWAMLVFLLAVISVWSTPARYSMMQRRTATILAAGCVFAAATVPAGAWAISRLIVQDEHSREALAIDGWIARAGGAVAVVSESGDGQDLVGGSNSLEALKQNYQRGVRWFELDVSLTSDGHVVAMADWARDTVVWFYQKEPGGRMTLREFEASKMRDDLTQISLASIADWMTIHPDAWILIDTNDPIGELLASEDIRRLGPDVKRRIIPIVRDPADARAPSEAGFEHYILSLNYREVPDHDAVWFARQLRPAAIAAHRVRWQNGHLAQRLAAEGVTTIASSVRTAEELRRAATDVAMSDVAAMLKADANREASRSNFLE